MLIKVQVNMKFNRNKCHASRPYRKENIIHEQVTPYLINENLIQSENKVQNCVPLYKYRWMFHFKVAQIAFHKLFRLQDWGSTKHVFTALCPIDPLESFSSFDQLSKNVVGGERGYEIGEYYTVHGESQDMSNRLLHLAESQLNFFNLYFTGYLAHKYTLLSNLIHGLEIVLNKFSMYH